MPIYFHSEAIDFSLTDQESILKWIGQIISQHARKEGDLNFIFTSNDYLLELNRKYLNHNYFTDVITFEYNRGDVIAGDIFISIDQVRINSNELNVDFIHELCRVIVHGVLHLLGYGDTTDDQKLVMRKKEDETLKVLESIQNGKEL